MLKSLTDMKKGDNYRGMMLCTSLIFAHLCNKDEIMVNIGQPVRSRARIFAWHHGHRNCRILGKEKKKDPSGNQTWLWKIHG